MAINFRSNTIIKNLSIGPIGGSTVPTVVNSVSSPYLLVSDKYDSSRAGAVYVYDATNYSAIPTKLVPSGLEADDFFGHSVAATTNQIVVGAFGDDDQDNKAGAAYVYDTSDLSATPTKLTPSGLGVDDSFGYAVAASSNQIVVGAFLDDDQGSNAGAVYVFNANNLSATPTKLTPSNLSSNHYFGRDVIVATPNHILVSSRLSGGTVFVYNANNLSTTPTIIGGFSNGNYAGGGFGRSVAVSSNYVVVGAYLDNDQGTRAGTAYVYNINNLSADPTEFSPSDLDAEDGFGYSVAVAGNHIAVGAYRDDDITTNSGAVYVYNASNLSATPTKLVPSDLGIYDEFGRSVSIQNNQLIASAKDAVYIYDITNLSATPIKLASSDVGATEMFGEFISPG